MAVELHWSDEGLAELEAVFDYISADSPEAAKAYVNRIRQTCEKLSAFPEMGRIYDPQYRVLVIDNHLALYRYDRTRQEVTIVKVIDGRRDVAQMLRDLKS